MIKIINISKKFSNKGLQTYIVMINDLEICKFKHKRKDGLAKCLEIASNAVSKYI